MKVSVIICTYTPERLKDLYEAIQSVQNQTRKPDEIIVCVDHNEELFEKLKFKLPHEVKLVLNDKAERGAVATDNVGIVHSNGDIIAFTDDDAVAAKDWLETLLKHYSDPSVVAVGGQIIPVWNNGHRPKWFPEELDWIVGGKYKGHPEIQTPVRNLILCNMSVRREVFRSIGFFAAELGRSKNWGTGAEAEFFLRTKHQLPDAIILYEPDAVVYHKVPAQRATLKYVALRSYNEGFHKARIERACANLSQNPLSTESFYFRYLFMTSIPRRLRYFYKKGSLSQVGAITASIAATGTGYLVGKIRK